MSYLKKVLIFIIALIAFTYFYFDLSSYHELSTIKQSILSLKEFFLFEPIQFISLYFMIYVLTTALSIPGATVLTVCGSAIMGFGLSLIVISFASTIGASIAFLLSRYLFKDYVEKKFQKQFFIVNENINKDGAYYLFSLRLMPVIPFFVINLVMGVTSIKLGTYYIISQIGMLAGTIVYVNAGSELGKINSLDEIMSIRIIISFILIGIFPLLMRKVLSMRRNI